MRMILSGGGTAGHINPAIAIADYVKEKNKGCEILYVGAKGGMEENLVKSAGYSFKSLQVTGFSRKINISGLAKNITTLKNFVWACRASKKILKEFQPDICIGTGGYVSGPIIWEAARLKIPTLIHEQNAYPGVTSRVLSKRTSAVMLASREAQKFFDKKCKMVITGNPVRKEIITAKKEIARKKLHLDSRPVIVSFGGSLGARKINEAIIDLICDTAKTDKYQIIHAFGKYGNWFVPTLKDRNIKLSEHTNFDIREYINDMEGCLAAADLVICRAGAISLSEIQVQGKASILIPSPNVAENHQYHNAMELVNNAAAEIIEEKNLTGQRLIDKVSNILKDKELLKKYEENSRKMAIFDANERIFNLIKEVLQ